MRTRWLKTMLVVAVLALVGAACGTNGGNGNGDPGAEAPSNGDAAAADLRVALFKLLGEHVNLAAEATGQALSGNQAGFEAAAGALDANSDDLAGAVASVYGPEAGDAFSPLWKKHIGFFVDYTQGVAAGDEARQQGAVDDLIGYTDEFGAFIESATDGRLPKDAVAGLVQEHVLTLKAAVDAQAAGDANAAYRELRGAYAHMEMIATGLAGAISDQFPERFRDDPATAQADLRVALFKLLGEHVNLAAAATGQALSGNQAGFEAAAGALDANSDDLAGAVGSVYGPEAGDAFSPLWKKHIGFFVDYTQGVAAGDEARQQGAVDDLIGYTDEFGAFIESATDGGLSKDAVAGLVEEHVLTLKSVVDAQAAGDLSQAYTDLRRAYAHMEMIATGLSGAIADQFPDKF